MLMPYWVLTKSCPCGNTCIYIYIYISLLLKCSCGIGSLYLRVKTEPPLVAAPSGVNRNQIYGHGGGIVLFGLGGPNIINLPLFHWEWGPVATTLLKESKLLFSLQSKSFSMFEMVHSYKKQIY